MNWRLRRAEIGDLDEIMQLENGTFGADAWSLDTMRRDLVNPQCYYLVAVAGNGETPIIGYAGLFCPDAAGEADIQTIAVAEAARRHGLGRALMRALIDEARTRSAAEVFLEVRADNPNAQNLYRSLGFQQLAVRAAYYQPEGVDAWVMRLVIGEPSTGLAEAGS